MRASSGRITAMAIGIPIALGSMGWGAFSMVGQLSLTSEHHEVNYPWHGGSISLNVDSGSVRVEVGSDSAVGVAYTEHYELKKPTVTSSVSTDGVAFKARCPGGIFDNNCFTNFVLTVPAAARITSVPTAVDPVNEMPSIASCVASRDRKSTRLNSSH